MTSWTRVDGYSVVKTTTPADDSGLATQGLDVLNEDTCDHSLYVAGVLSPHNECLLTIDSSADDGDVFSITIYAGSDGGGVEIIGSLLCTVGSAVTGSGNRWVDTITVTNRHLAEIKIADSGNNSICKVGFDALGNRYFYFHVEAITCETTDTINIRLRTI